MLYDDRFSIKVLALHPNNVLHFLPHLSQTQHCSTSIVTPIIHPLYHFAFMSSPGWIYCSSGLSIAMALKIPLFALNVSSMERSLLSLHATRTMKLTPFLSRFDEIVTVPKQQFLL